jgi:predicted secreted protein
MSDITTGFGTKFRRWDSVLGAWEDIAKIVSIDGPSMSRETIDTTTLDNTEGYRTFIGSLRDGGTVGFTMQFSRARYEKIKADFENDENQNYEILLPDAELTSIEFEGLVTELPIGVEIDAVITCEVSIKVSGKATIDSGSGS